MADEGSSFRRWDLRVLTLIGRDDSLYEFTAGLEEPFASPTAERLWELIRAIRVGAW